MKKKYTKKERVQLISGEKQFSSLDNGINYNSNIRDKKSSIKGVEIGSGTTVIAIEIVKEH